MKNKISKQELIEILVRFPQGASTKEIMLAFTPRPRRTIQRWLVSLVQGGQVEALGAARARRYRLKPKTSIGAPRQNASILLSNEALEIEDFVTKPIAARQPVSYRRQWLEDCLLGSVTDVMLASAGYSHR